MFVNVKCVFFFCDHFQKRAKQSPCEVNFQVLTWEDPIISLKFHVILEEGKKFAGKYGNYFVKIRNFHVTAHCRVPFTAIWIIGRRKKNNNFFCEQREKRKRNSSDSGMRCACSTKKKIKENKRQQLKPNRICTARARDLSHRHHVCVCVSVVYLSTDKNK